jgi:succinyl-CoA synthetase beta subunit
MNVHEYQAKALLREYGVAVPEGSVASTPAEAESAARALDSDVVVVKAQVHAGGRGKAGGIKLAKSASEAKTAASEILGMTLRTAQTGADGKVVRKVYVEAGSDIASELYLAVVLDRATEKLAVIASTEGGVEIEEVAANTPERIVTVAIDPNLGLQPYHVRRVGFGIGLSAQQVAQLEGFLSGLYRLFVEKDASLAEINPLVLTGAGDLVALDAKLNFDDNALYRHPEIVALHDPDEEDPRELEAKQIDLAYVGLDGEIGCADKEKVKEAFKIILRDPNVKAILVNIFGGIVRCDLIAEGVAAAADELGIGVPLVVRLQGTNAAEGRRILAESGLDITPAETLAEAGERAVAAVRATG